MKTTRFQAKRITQNVLVAALLALASVPWVRVSAETPQQKGRAIADKMRSANAGFRGETSKSELILVNAYGDRTVRKLEAQVVEVAGDGDRSLIEFGSPADVRGTRMLTWAHRENDDDQWLYLPALRQVKRITTRNQSSSFMGSEFSYEDLSGQEPDKFEFEFIGEETLSGRKCFKLKRVSKNSRSGYSRQLLWVDQEHFGLLKSEFYDRKDELLKTATFEEYKKYGKWWRPQRVVMKNHLTKKESLLVWSERKMMVSLDAGAFESASLRD